MDTLNNKEYEVRNDLRYEEKFYMSLSVIIGLIIIIAFLTGILITMVLI